MQMVPTRGAFLLSYVWSRRKKNNSFIINYDAFFKLLIMLYSYFHDNALILNYGNALFLFYGNALFLQDNVLNLKDNALFLL